MLRFKLRFRILASTIPLILAAVFARSELRPAAGPCISLGETSVQLAQGFGQAPFNVSFTSDRAAATVRVQIVDSAEMADFAVVDDIDTAEADACPVSAATRFIAIAATPSTAEPVIYLSPDGDADYRIFVQSSHFTAREAAALIVGAGGGRAPVVHAAL
jgi:hypothetical protein